MIIIVLTNTFNQKHVIGSLRRLKVAEEKIIAEGGTLSYRGLFWKIIVLVLILTGGEIIMMVYYMLTTNYMASLSPLGAISSWFWIFYPITLTSLARLWFIALMAIPEMFFDAINSILTTTGDALEALEEFPARKLTKEPIFNEFLGQKLLRMCQLHGEVGKISLAINHVFHVENLLANIFTILLTVTLMYFIYLAALNQQIPPLFRSVDNMTLSVFYVIFGLWKVFYVIFVASEVKRKAQLTGSCLHQIAVAVDEVPCYRLINQLSIQIWQQRLEFPVGGFFLLDMSTIGAFSGAILVYVIILIQFNLAGGT
ncbi:Gustatory receptor [Sergentomyia squamirostris]